MKRQGTKPERAVRAALLRLGEKFACNVEMLGTPDVVLPGNRAIFVHGCLFHGHDHVRVPPHLEPKVRKNQARDRATCARLAGERTPWRVLTVWECETRNFDLLRERLRAFVNA